MWWVSAEEMDETMWLDVVIQQKLNSAVVLSIFVAYDSQKCTQYELKLLCDRISAVFLSQINQLFQMNPFSSQVKKYWEI